jgi:hypothetical protein
MPGPGHLALGAALAAGRVGPRQAEAILAEVQVLPALADRAEVVARLVGPPLGSPSAVDDPDEPAAGPALVRELRSPGASLWPSDPRGWRFAARDSR